VGNLKYLSSKTDLPLVQLLGGYEGFVTPDNGKSHEEMTTADALAEIATYATGVGPWKHALVTIDEAANQLTGKTDLAERIQAANMQVRFIQRTDSS
jgi:glycerophosphoryl diester phosphodiesterase